VICRTAVDEPPGPITVSSTLYVPGMLKVCAGLRSALPVPSRKFHAYALIVPVD